MKESRFQQLLENYGNFLAASSGVGSPYGGLFALFHLTHISAGQITMTIQYVGDQHNLLEQAVDAIRLDDLDHVGQIFPVGYHHYLGPSISIRRMPWLEATQILNSSGPNQRGKYKSAYMIKPFADSQIEVA